MQQRLVSKLHNHLQQFYPELLIGLEDRGETNTYLNQKTNRVESLIQRLKATGTPNYIIEEECLHTLTADLGVSRYNYLQALLEQEFETVYYRMWGTGTLHYELINLINFCASIFESFDFCEANEDDRMLRYAIIGTVQEYLDTLNQPHGL
ncbi:hypothetical protein AWW67_13205 [Roseivirga seohaensis]|jgi:hypothetical protein|uniref:Uncharacterized protein n=1 Tax=Roseivirga seohaensis TaxID=1914963 RepID=A0A150XKR3_9BACT|nr:DUF1896 family protein [Roseivirga seohaensis]KYG79327.1 hypothetical protein AWW67_13205 [Roseivirga seohaensis]|tara:strand:+ start:124 stop:576 length:453 start_codon:yes stop_codon:yes gene_type:complete